MELKSLISKNKVISLEYPGAEGFTLDLCYLSRDKSLELRKKCTKLGFNKKTRQPEESIDEIMFAKVYASTVIKGWTGLKLKYLSDLVPVELPEGADLESELEYSADNAEQLINNSTYLDSWVGEVISDVAYFNKDS